MLIGQGHGISQEAAPAAVVLAGVGRVSGRLGELPVCWWDMVLSARNAAARAVQGRPGFL